MKWKAHVVGYKDWKIVLRPGSPFGVVRGELVEEDIIVEAENRFEAAKLAEKEFEKNGYYFDEVVWAEPVQEGRL